uniref:Uncharacterized protein n=1 Tax=Arundo donax TaxID=35708 RepID=A0A0A9FU92_ARUDO
MACKFNHPADRKLVTLIHSSTLFSGIRLYFLCAYKVLIVFLFVSVLFDLVSYVFFVMFEALKWVRNSSCG